MFKNLLKLSRFSASVSNDAKRRVISTNQWPIPYQNRFQKAYPVREKKQLDISSQPHLVDDNLFIQTFEALQQHKKEHLVKNV